MEKLSIWKTIKIGFWLGIGFIVPQLIVLYSGTAITMLAMPSYIDSSFNEDIDTDNSNISSFVSKFDKTKQIEIKEYREQKNGNQLLILGAIVNNGNNHVSSINLEAELIDKNGKFVYECSEYITKRLKPNDTENFQIKCGCGKNPIPEYATVNIRVVSASSY